MSEEQIVEKTEQQIQVEKEARTLGWVPQSEYRDGDHFVDAETFVKRGKEINPILRKNNEILLRKLAERDFASRVSASPTVLPFKTSVIKDAEAVEIAHPAPWKVTLSITPPCSFRKTLHRSPHSGL